VGYVEIVEHRTAAQGGGSGAPWMAWTINRPERLNGIGPTLVRDLGAALAAVQGRAAHDRPVLLSVTAKPVVNGERRTWIAGGDLKELAGVEGSSGAKSYGGATANILRGLDALPMPVVVALDGDAIGGGAELALAGDLRIATRASRLVFKQLEIGLATGYGTTRRLVALVGLARAQEILLTARTLTAEEALALGLVHEVVADDKALTARVEALAGLFATLEPKAVAAQKHMLRLAVTEHPGAAQREEIATFAALWGNETHKKTLARFAEPRAKGNS
jgi:enoyl-CoA hydratase